jgi:hypothetical protein
MKKDIKKWSICVVLYLILSSFGVAADKNPDCWPTNAWRTATPESQGMDSYRLVDILDRIRNKGLEIHNVLIIRNGYMVLDAYRYPFSPDIPHHIDACTQSITSAPIGIAIDRGYITDVNQTLLGFFPYRMVRNIDAYI